MCFCSKIRQLKHSDDAFEVGASFARKLQKEGAEDSLFRNAYEKKTVQNLPR